ncbi:MAG: hypothetical protein ACRDF4_08895 [Rhabdochlamydiaceae bacterium]
MSTSGSKPPEPPTTQPTQQPKQSELLPFHFAEFTSCREILPLSTTTEKYFTILGKDPAKPVGLGEKCMRCGADSWVLARNSG